MSHRSEMRDQTFWDEMKDVKPLPKNDKIDLTPPEHTLAQQLKREALEREVKHLRNFLSVEKVEPLDPFDYLSYKESGVQEGVFKQLRLGKYKIESVLNIQNQTFEKARSAVFNAVIHAYEKGNRTILVQHGMGLHSKPFAGFLKSYTQQWLSEMPQVLAFHTAQRQHGGLAAVYVLLKKNNQQKLANSELHRRR